MPTTGGDKLSETTYKNINDFLWSMDANIKFQMDME